MSASIIVFSLTLIINGFKFSEKANQFRECYLRLQSLYRADTINGERYDEILLSYPNHSTSDYVDFVIEQNKFGSFVKKPGRDEAIVLGWMAIVSHYFWRICFWIFLVVVPFLSPILFMWFVISADVQDKVL